MTEYKAQYNEQRKQARGRGIEWQFTYETWLDWWGNDIVNRGRGKDKLCMARINDTGAYHPDNVYKATNSQNGIEASRTRPKADPANVSEGLRLAWKNKNPSLMKRCMRIKTPYGTFESQSAAARALGVTQGTIWSRMKAQPDQYYKENQS
jgi:hypothetical protein